MTTYLTIITTALVVTQIIRLIQNAIQLHNFNLECKELKKKNVRKGDFENRERAYGLTVEKLEKELPNEYSEKLYKIAYDKALEDFLKELFIMRDFSNWETICEIAKKLKRGGINDKD